MLQIAVFVRPQHELAQRFLLFFSGFITVCGGSRLAPVRLPFGNVSFPIGFTSFLKFDAKPSTISFEFRLGFIV